MNELELLRKHAIADNGLVFGYLEPSRYEIEKIPNILGYSPEQYPYKVLLSHEYSRFIPQIGFYCPLSPQTIWNLICSIQYYHFDFDPEDEGISDIIIIHLVSQFYGCVPFHASPTYFDCFLDLFCNWEASYVNPEMKHFDNSFNRSPDDYLTPLVKKEIRRIAEIAYGYNPTTSSENKSPTK